MFKNIWALDSWVVHNFVLISSIVPSKEIKLKDIITILNLKI
jgi:hypothetical protein